MILSCGNEYFKKKANKPTLIEAIQKAIWRIEKLSACMFSAMFVFDPIKKNDDLKQVARKMLPDISLFKYLGSVAKTDSIYLF